MQAVIRGFVSQSAQMDPLEKMRRWKRSFDNLLSFRKAATLGFVFFVFLLYLGPTVFSWLFGGGGMHSPGRYSYYPRQSCVGDRFAYYGDDLTSLSAHSLHYSPQWRPTDRNYVPYVGNGHLGMAVTESEGVPVASNLYIFGRRHLNVKVPFRPSVVVTPAENTGASISTPVESAAIVHYTHGLVHAVSCYRDPSDYGGDGDKLGVSSVHYAHRSIPGVLVQEVKVTNPSANTATFNVERIGIDGWEGARTSMKTIEHGDGSHNYVVVTGSVSVPPPPDGHDDEKLFKVVAVVVRKLPSSVEASPRMTQSLNVLTAVAYSEPVKKDQLKKREEKLRESTSREAIKSLQKALSTTSNSLRQSHVDVWGSLWTTGFGISPSLADNAVNGDQINATMYYVLSQVPAPLHYSLKDMDQVRELEGQLAYAEGCYGGVPTLQAATLWRSLATLEDVNGVVKSWILTLEKNGCNKLVKVGADGVAQAMVLSFAGLKFREEHLELNSQPKDLHRDYHIRRISYGNGTHLNISVVVQSDNKAVLLVALDRRHRDYFACDAGCLDPPARLTTQHKQFPVKLTDPLTAILYITADYRHMRELKEAIHVKEVAEAPAHEHHVIALHKHGNKLGGLPTVFWFSIGFLIFVFHLFLFKLIWQEYCAANDKYRSRKFSDYN